ncbi:MAG: epoxyqueuosine reductase QueH [Dehalococcoidia bacterium]|jgi:predicted adenine nucleotide alpha hydrolase (AANH) superfamily ATPase
MKRLLIHSCCAHCAAYTVEHWRQEGYEVSAFWYNPNIHPYTEHQKRLEAMQTLAGEMNVPLIDRGGYDVVEYFRRVAGHEDERCRHCFDLRLAQTAETAREMGFDAFTTTLLISPHQKHDLLKEIGEALGKETGTDFLYADLRKRYSDSRHITKPMDLHRQQYCGCLYSEWERYAGLEIK